MGFGYVYSPNIWPAIPALILVFIVAIFSLRHRGMPGAIPLSAACILGVIWLLGMILEFSALEIADKIFWRKLQVMVQLPSATAVTLFLLEYTWPKRFLTRLNLILLSIVPILMIIMIITNDLHHWFWEGFVIDRGLEAISGPLMKYFIGYIFLNFLMNLVILVWLFTHSRQNRWPVVFLLSGQMMMRLFYLIDIADRTSNNLPYSVFGITITSLMYAIVLFRFQIFGPMSLARQAVPKQLPIGIIVLDDKEKIRSINPAAERILKLNHRAAKGGKIRDLLAVYPQKRLHDSLEAPIEFSLDQKGNQRFYLLDIKVLHDWRDLQIGQLLLITDVTDQREAQTKVLEQGRVLAILQEREQIARELHDDLAQVFGFIDTQGQTIQRLIDRDDLDTAHQYLTRLIDAAREGEVDIRETIRGMRSALSEHGLINTLEKQLCQFEKDTSITTHLEKSDYFEIHPINPMVEVQLLRILQEALTNIRKHARASQLWINFNKIDSHLCVTIRDDGQGFDMKSDGFSDPNHFGLKMMRERAEAIGGSVQLSSQPDQGVNIKVCVPADQPKAAV